MENQSSLAGKNESIETMFKSLNTYTSELQQGSISFRWKYSAERRISFVELEILNGKLNDQIRIEQNHDKSQEQRKNIDEMLIERAKVLYFF